LLWNFPVVQHFMCASNLEMEENDVRIISNTQLLSILILIGAIGICLRANASELDKSVIEKAAKTEARLQGDVIRIGWSRNDVTVHVDGMLFPPSAGLGSWAAFKSTGRGQDAVVMGDTVVFQDEVDNAMDAAFSHGLEVTALHNHFFYDEPKVYFMHIGGHGSAANLAGAVKAVWDAIKQVRAATPKPASGFPGSISYPNGKIDPELVKKGTGLDPTVSSDGVVKISSGRVASVHGTEIGGSMGLTSWAAFTGSDVSAVMDGDFIMSAAETQPVLKTLRKENLHIVALHNHMIGEQPNYYFTHFWGKGSVLELAEGFKAALEAQKKTTGQ